MDARVEKCGKKKKRKNKTTTGGSFIFLLEGVGTIHFIPFVHFHPISTYLPWGRPRGDSHSLHRLHSLSVLSFTSPSPTCAALAHCPSPQGFFLTSHCRLICFQNVCSGRYLNALLTGLSSKRAGWHPKDKPISMISSNTSGHMHV